MAIVPETRSEKIQFYQTHLRAWAEDPASIGVTPEAVATLAGLVDEARAAYAAHRQAQQAARTATAAYHRKVGEMHAGLGGGAILLQTIKTFAATTGDPNVYSRARIPSPTSPGRPGSAPPPGQPRDIEAQLFQTGELKLTWKCDNPDGTVGTIYHVRRRLEGAGAFTFIGTAGSDKSFTDYTVPAGTRYCVYVITALRSTRRGAPAQYTVYFGGSMTPGLRLPQENLSAA